MLKELEVEGVEAEGLGPEHSSSNGTSNRNSHSNGNSNYYYYSNNLRRLRHGMVKTNWSVSLGSLFNMCCKVLFGSAESTQSR